MKLYFGNTVTTVTTIMLLLLFGFIGTSIWTRSNINCWGRRSLFLLVYGLTICCFTAARDGLDKTIQNTIDGSCGAFSIGKYSKSDRMHRSSNHYHCCNSNTDCKNTTYA